LNCLVFGSEYAKLLSETETSILEHCFRFLLPSVFTPLSPHSSVSFPLTKSFADKNKAFPYSLLSRMSPFLASSSDLTTVLATSVILYKGEVSRRRNTVREVPHVLRRHPFMYLVDWLSSDSVVSSVVSSSSSAF